MFKKIFFSILIICLGIFGAKANDKLTVVLDWYLNPDHAPLIVAEQIGSFEKRGLDVEIVTPSDPNIGPRLVASDKADIALSYQQQLYIFQDEELPLTRIGTLIETPLNTVLALPDSGIKTPADLKGKKVGFSVSSIEPVILGTMLENQGLTIKDVELINVNFNLVSGLMSKQVDAVIGGYRNVEGNELREQGVEPVIMKVEDYGIPPYDELIFVAKNDLKKHDAYKKFLEAVHEGQQYLKAHPQETWDNFAKKYKELDTDLNKKIWMETVPLFSENPLHLDKEKYVSYGAYLYKKGIVKKEYPLDSFATELK